MKFLLTTLSLLFISTSIAQTNTKISTANFFEGEPYLTIDPSNDQHLIAAWMGFKISEAIVIKTSNSYNGGLTWSTPNAIAHEQTGNTSADVSLGYNSNGVLFICYIDFDNTNFTNGKIIVRKSIDNGLNWGTSVEAINITDCPNQLCIDRPWMVIDNMDRIFITTMNADQPTLVNAPYHPYFVVSSDDGNTFTTPNSFDGTNFLAGSVIKQPTPAPAIGADGTFYATYPSYVFAQDFNAQMFLAKSTNAGSSFNYTTIYTGSDAVSDPFAKKGFVLVTDPTAPNHIGLIALYDINGDSDVYYSETIDGITWTALQRVNQDPIANGKMQDLVWGDFNSNGDLAICWRDRRNATSNGYQTETEIFGAVKFKDSSTFSNDFVISSQQVSHDAILEGSGNDFMHVQFQADTIYAVWGDVRTGTLNIFINKTNVTTGVSSLSEIYTEKGILSIFPNPSEKEIQLKSFELITNVELYNSRGEFIQKIEHQKTNIQQLHIGEYLIIYTYKGKRFCTKFIKN